GEHGLAVIGGERLEALVHFVAELLERLLERGRHVAVFGLTLQVGDQSYGLGTQILLERAGAVGDLAEPGAYAVGVGVPGQLTEEPRRGRPVVAPAARTLVGPLDADADLGETA